jgi:hypothetical protein
LRGGQKMVFRCGGQKMVFRYGVVAIAKESGSLGLMGVAHTPEEANEIRRRVELAGLWRDIEVCDGLDELADYAMKHRTKRT